MSEFNICENGHYYAKDQDKCPYCPKKDDNLKTVASSNNLEKTKIFSDDGNNEVTDNSKTVIHNETENVTSNDLSKTIIHTESSNETSDDSSPMQSSQRQSGRKLVGWLVSFTIDPLGIDFKLYEGRNTVGSDNACDIVINNDSLISGKHLTILYRREVYKFKDEFSTNGTFINDEFVEQGDLVDGDLIKVGSSELKFRSI